MLPNVLLHVDTPEEQNLQMLKITPPHLDLIFNLQEHLQWQLQEANRKAQSYRQQLLCKEQEAEEYRMKLEAMENGQSNGTMALDQEHVVFVQEEVGIEETMEGEEEVVMFSEGDVVIKTEEIDSADEQITLVEATAGHTEVIS